MAKNLRLQFIKKENIQKDIFVFYFTPSEEFSFIAGQYVQVTLPHPKVDERGTSRFFTISSSPTEKYIMITTHVGESSFKRKLFTLKSKTTLQAFGPMGTFVLEDSRDESKT